jgi:histidine ammonia-lyase
MTKKIVTLSEKKLTINEVKAVARDFVKVKVSPKSFAKCKKGRKVLEYYINKKKKIYGVTTGFGSLSKYFIEADKASQLQVNLLRSHNAGVGKPVPQQVVRATMLARAKFISSGMSGARPVVLKTLVKMLNKNVVPFIPQQGSVGSSGDLAPLAAMALVLMGEGEAFWQGQKMPGKKAMQKAGIKTIKILSKEGLALINGDTLMVGYAALAVYDAINLTKLSDLGIALTLEGILGVKEAFENKLQKSRGFKGQINSAKNIRSLIKGSQILAKKGPRVQDSYVIRCSPVIMGASRDAISYVKKQIETELNGSCDNPLVYFDSNLKAGGQVLAGGNFHGQPAALPLDFLGIAVSELANSAEIRMERLLNPNYSEGLPPFLMPKPGLDSGFMVPQYTAAGLVNENKGLAWPNSVDSIPVCAGQEDHVSMGTNSALSVWRIINNTQYVLGIEIFIGAQALDLREQISGKKASPANQAVRDFVRTKIPFIKKDQSLQQYIEQMKVWVENENLLKIIKNKKISLV